MYDDHENNVRNGTINICYYVWAGTTTTYLYYGLGSLTEPSQLAQKGLYSVQEKGGARKWACKVSPALSVL